MIAHDTLLVRIASRTARPSQVADDRGFFRRQLAAPRQVMVHGGAIDPTRIASRSCGQYRAVLAATPCRTRGLNPVLHDLASKTAQRLVTKSAACASRSLTCVNAAAKSVRAVISRKMFGTSTLGRGPPLLPHPPPVDGLDQHEAEVQYNADSEGSAKTGRCMIVRMGFTHESV
jgi:hypothetical protein